MAANRNSDNQNKDVIVEFIPYGRYVKVSAIDVITQEEISIVGDASRSQKELAQLAIKKLRYIQSKR